MITKKQLKKLKKRIKALEREVFGEYEVVFEPDMSPKLEVVTESNIERLRLPFETTLATVDKSAPPAPAQLLAEGEQLAKESGGGCLHPSSFVELDEEGFAFCIDCGEAL
jgi:hypothetical protein